MSISGHAEMMTASPVSPSTCDSHEKKAHREHSHKQKDKKRTRSRTVLNDRQLRMLEACYSANPRPDALLSEQLVEMTNLPLKVVRTWFINKRCKDKRRQLENASP